MAKFCTKCGKPLEEGEVCSCQTVATQSVEQKVVENQSVDQQPDFQYQPAAMPAQTANPSQAEAFVKRLFSNILLLLKEPVEMGREFIESADVTMAMAFIVIQGIISGVFGMAVEGKAVATLKSSMGFLSGMFSSSAIKIPYLKSFFGTLVISVILTLVLAGLLLAANLIFKNQVTYKEMICEASMRSICIMPVAIVSLVLLLLSPGLGIVLFFSANLWGIILMSQVNPVRDDSRENYLPIALYIAISVFMLISCYVMYKSAGLYVPDGMNTSISEILSDLM